MTEFSREVCSSFITLYNLNINLYKIGQTWDTKGNMYPTDFLDICKFFPQLRLCFCKFNYKCCSIAFKFWSNKLGSYLILCKKFKF